MSKLLTSIGLDVEKVRVSMSFLRAAYGACSSSGERGSLPVHRYQPLRQVHCCKGFPRTVGIVYTTYLTVN
jgi:hypothetical protein